MIFKTLRSSILFLSIGLMFAGNWKVESAKSKITFTVNGFFGTVHGNFSGLEAEVEFQESDLSRSFFSASIDAKTVSTGISMRDNDLKKEAQWLDTEKYPRISYKSKQILKTSSGYKVMGELTLKGITRPVEIPFTFTSSGNTGLYKGQFVIKRTDYHLGKVGGSVGSDVTIHLEIPVTK